MKHVRFTAQYFYAFFYILCALYAFTYASNTSEPIKIATIFAKSGVAASVADEYDLSALAIKKVNNKGGIFGRKIEIIEYDNQSTAEGTKRAALEAIKENVSAVIGATWSSHSLVLATELQKARIPMITPLSTNPSVTQTGNYIFRACFTDPFQGKVMAYFASQYLHAKTAAILVNTSSDYSMQLAEFFKRNAKQYGISILYEQNYFEQTNDFSQIMSNIKNVHPDIIFSPSMIRDGGLIILQTRKMNIPATLLGGDGWGQLVTKYTGNDINNIFYSDHWHSQANLKEAQTLVEEFKNMYKRDIDINSALLICYDAANLLVDAIQRANSSDPNKIRDALAETKNFKGITGMISFDANGDPIDKQAVIKTIKNGECIFYKSIKFDNYTP